MSQIEFANLQEAIIFSVGPTLELILGLVMVFGVALSIIHITKRPQHGNR